MEPQDQAVGLRSSSFGAARLVVLSHSCLTDEETKPVSVLTSLVTQYTVVLAGRAGAGAPGPELLVAGCLRRMQEGRPGRNAAPGVLAAAPSLCAAAAQAW